MSVFDSINGLPCRITAVHSRDKYSDLDVVGITGVFYGQLWDICDDNKEMLYARGWYNGVFEPDKDEVESDETPWHFHAVKVEVINKNFRATKIEIN